MRQQTSGVRVVATMLGAAAELEVPEQDWADLQEIIDLTTDIIAWDNDITSYAGELREGRAELNLITVIQQQLGKSEAEAIDTVVRMCNQKEARLIQLQQQQLSGRDISLAALNYVKGVRQWIDGYLGFVRHMAGDRYKPEATDAP